MRTLTSTQAYWKGRPVMYRVFDHNGRLIYIGASHDLPVRMKFHEQATWWFGLVGKIRVQVFADRQAAFAAEAVAIQEEQPTFNSKHTGRPEGDYSTWTADDLRFCKAWRDEDASHRVRLPLTLWPLLRDIA